MQNLEISLNHNILKLRYKILYSIRENKSTQKVELPILNPMIATPKNAIAKKKFPTLKQNKRVPILLQLPIIPHNPKHIKTLLKTYNAIKIPSEGFYYY